MEWGERFVIVFVWLVVKFFYCVFGKGNIILKVFWIIVDFGECFFLLYKFVFYSMRW